MDGVGLEYVRWNYVRSCLEEIGYIKPDDFKDMTGKDSVPKFIPENVFYRLCMKTTARNKLAQQFQVYVCDVVLPSIRKNGGYVVGQEQLLETNEDKMAFISRALKVATNIIEESDKKNAELTIQNKEQQQEIHIMAPKAEFADAIMGSDTSIGMSEMAALLTQNGFDVGRTNLFKMLRNSGYLGIDGKLYNLPTRKSVQLGLFEVKRTVRRNQWGQVMKDKDGKAMVTETTLVTVKGQEYFLKRVEKWKEKNAK